MVAMKCRMCKEDIELRRKECEEEGKAYHAACFRCCVCDNSLNEYNVKIRGKKLYCEYHAKFLKELQPFSKVYYLAMNTCYRIILASDKKSKDDEKGEEGDEEEEEEEEE